ncbi:DUF881 domain-containing protein [Paenibacillus sp. TRM 82003]|uniref:DUF881 domain-containing protein n=1 Tax=Kineococcus sp. TRM81007 TaxID=2925831 RepID=UPI001F589CCB|nr:DUF881 domain-containing protein [Kineococcus sp. TRM81007]MCI2240668.1 DUF881 domain-containing protein [Kineococcus sp. TRM81007]MCI3925410.1 DUF881 domain-containing protein [Paenibacillus sp. TRM 82003]
MSGEPGPRPPGARPAASPWRRLWRAARPRATRAQLLAGVLCAALGFGVVVQVRQTDVAGLADLRESDLVRILDDAGERGDRLAEEVRELERTRSELTAGSDSAEAAARAAEQRALELGLLAGTVPAVGPGITATIADPAGEVGAAAFVSLVQELRDAGAEAIQVGDVRVVASTAFEEPPAGAGAGVVVDGTLLTPPYEVRVVGDPQTVATALDIPGGVRESLRQLSAELSVETAEEVRVTALHAVSSPQYARPASPGATAGSE